MLEEGSDCQQVLTQLAAVKAAVDQVGLHLMSERLRTCMADGNEGDCATQFEEAMATFLRFATLAREVPDGAEAMSPRAARRPSGPRGDVHHIAATWWRGLPLTAARSARRMRELWRRASHTASATR